MINKKKLLKGFTLVELVVTISVIAVLAGVSVGAYFGITDSAKKSKLETEAKQTFDGIRLISLSNQNQNQSLTNEGLKVSKGDTDFKLFEEDLSYAVGIDYDVDDARPNTIVGKTIILKENVMTLSLVRSNDYFTFKSFNYYTNEVDGYFANVNMLTGEIIVLPDDYVEEDIPPVDEPEIITFKELVIYKSNYKYQYFEGDTIDLTGLKFYEKYSDGTINNEEIPHSELTYNKNPLTKDITNFEFSYTKDGVTSTVGISILVNEVVLNDLLIEGNLTKTNYIHGQNIDLTGLKFVALYNNGDREENVNVTYNPILQAGQTSIEVTYEGISKTINGLTVEEIKPQSLLVSGVLNKTSYFEGETIDLTGLTFKVKNNDNSTFIIEDLNNIHTSTLNVGDTSVEVSYTIGEYTLYATITEIEVKEIKPVELVISDFDEDFYEGTSLNEVKESLTYKVKYSNEEQYRNLTPNDITISFKGEDQQSKGEKIIIFTYTDSDTNKSISVEKSITFIDIKAVSLTSSSSTLMKTQYAGNKLDISGITFIATFNNGETREVEVNTPTLSLGQTSATVTYESLSYTFKNISVEKAGFYLVEDLNTLKEGDSFIVVSKEYKKTIALKESWDFGGTFQHPTNYTQITFENQMINISDEYLIFTLEKGKNEGTFAFKTEYGYLTYSKGITFGVTFLPEITDEGSWSFSYEKVGFSDEASHIITTTHDNNTRYFTFYYDGSAIYFGGSTSKDYDTFIYKLNGNQNN